MILHHTAGNHLSEDTELGLISKHISRKAMSLSARLVAIKLFLDPSKPQPARARRACGTGLSDTPGGRREAPEPKARNARKCQRWK